MASTPAVLPASAAPLAGGSPWPAGPVGGGAVGVARVRTRPPVAKDSDDLFFIALNMHRQGQLRGLSDLLEHVVATYKPDVVVLSECLGLFVRGADGVFSMSSGPLADRLARLRFSLVFDQALSLPHATDSAPEGGGVCMLVSHRLQVTPHVRQRRTQLRDIFEVWVDVAFADGYRDCPAARDFRLTVGGTYIRPSAVSDTVRQYFASFPASGVLLGDLNMQLAGDPQRCKSIGTRTINGRIFESEFGDHIFAVPHLLPSFVTTQGPNNRDGSETTLDHVLYTSTTLQDTLEPHTMHVDTVTERDDPVVAQYTDHRMIMWRCAVVGVPSTNPPPTWARRTRVDWPSVTPDQLARYNARVLELLGPRDPTPRSVSCAVHTASLDARVGFKLLRGGAYSPKQLQPDDTRETLKRNFEELVRRDLHPDVVSTEAWKLLRRHFGVNRKASSIAPLVVPQGPGQPDLLVYDSEEKAAHIADHIESLHAPDPNVVVESYVPSGRAIRRFSATELRAAVTKTHNGTCADDQLVQMEHFKKLDDACLRRVLVAAQAALDWKTAFPAYFLASRVAALPKPHRPRTVASLRGIFITPCFARIIETMIVHELLSKYASAESQFGFLQNVPVTLPLVALTSHTLRCAADAKRPVVLTDSLLQDVGVQRPILTLVVCVDVVSAFCRAIPDVIARRVAEAHPDLAPIADWLRLFMTDRTFRVVHEGGTSTTRTAKGGIGQGTNSAPALWAVFLDELQCALQRRAELPDTDDTLFQEDLSDQALLAANAARDTAACNQHSRSLQAVNTEVIVATVADDVNFWVSHRDGARCVAKANSMLTVIHDFCVRYGLKLAKVKGGFISGIKQHMTVNWLRDHTCELRCGALFDPFVPRLADMKLLGLQLSADSRFGDHVSTVVGNARSRLAAFAPLVHRVPAHILHIIYESCILAPLLHASDVWGPFVGKASWTRLERVHAAGARFITGCRRSTNTIAVLREAGLRDIRFHVERNIARTHEKLLQFNRNAKHGPGLVAYLAQSPLLIEHGASALVRDSDTRFALHSVDRYAPCFPYGQRGVFSPLTNNCRSGWLARNERPFAPVDVAALDHNWTVVDAPPGGLSKKKDPVADLHAANMQRMDELRALAGPDRYELHTDGSLCGNSTAAGVWGGGAYVVLRFSDGIVHSVVTRDVCCTSESSASYTPEFLAIRDGFRRFADLSPQDSLPLLHFTDSQSTLSELRRGPLLCKRAAAFPLWRSLIDVCRCRSVTAAFLFSHVAPPGVRTENDCVDALAKAAARDSCADWMLGPRRTSVVVWPKDALRSRMDWLEARERGRVAAAVTASVAGGTAAPLRTRHAPSFEPALLPSIARPDQILVAQLRTGVCPAIGGDRHEIPPELQLCPLCQATGFGRGGTAVLHAYSCAQMADFRDKHGWLTFDCVFSTDLDTLRVVVEYARAFASRSAAVAAPDASTLLAPGAPPTTDLHGALQALPLSLAQHSSTSTPLAPSATFTTDLHGASRALPSSSAQRALNAL